MRAKGKDTQYHKNYAENTKMSRGNLPTVLNSTGLRFFKPLIVWWVW